MRGREIIRAIMEKTGVNNVTLAARLGVTPQVTWDRVNSKKTKDIPVSTLNETLRQLDYKVVIVPRNTRIAADWYEVT